MKLADLGWSSFFARQLTPAELRSVVPGRVTAMQRTGVTLTLSAGEREVPLGGRWYRGDAQSRPAVGDWVLFNPANGQIDRVLERKSLLRRAAGVAAKEVRLIGANVDTLFVVTSCNDEFNLSRLERYLGLAREGDTRAVVVLTKRDLCENPAQYAERVAALDGTLKIETVNALDRATLGSVTAWCGPGQTVALVGSSGVGKSTLVNTLSGTGVQATGAVRRSDRKGRHTTTSRSLHPLPQGGWLLDSPGTRELRLVGTGVAALFEDIEKLARRCRFANCAHAGEPGCAVARAVRCGELAARRLGNYQKLKREQARG